MILRVEWSTHDGTRLFSRAYKLPSDEVEAIARGLAALDAELRPVLSAVVDSEPLADLVDRWRARDRAADWPAP